MNKTLQNTGGCRLCPRACGVRREEGETGLCGAGPLPRVARAAPHHYEEPCISGTNGSGTVFFTGCPLGCAFCQNHAISRRAGAGHAVGEAELAETFLRLQAEGVHNLNLVSATHHRPAVLAALRLARQRGLHLPAIWNTGGYEAADAAASLHPAISIHLADCKFYSPALSQRLAGAPDYFEHASRYISDACRLAGPPQFGADGLLQRGVVVRVLVLPGETQDAMQILQWLAEGLPRGGFMLSLMRQYTPPSGLPPLGGALNRRLASYEYRQVCNEALRLGLSEGYFQQKESASEAFLPPFEC